MNLITLTICISRRETNEMDSSQNYLFFLSYIWDLLKGAPQFYIGSFIKKKSPIKTNNRGKSREEEVNNGIIVISIRNKNNRRMRKK